MSSDNGRLSVSEEKIKLLLADFKLELVKEFEKFATTAALEMLDARVKVLELWQAGIVGIAKERNDVSRRTLAYVGIAAALLGSLATLIWLSR